MPNNELLKTPQEFIEEESEKLRNHLKNYDVHVNKLGVIGFFMNLLGNLKYDSTQYYQGLMKESFVALAEHENNLYMHASIYGYNVSYASPSIASGSFTFDFSYLPKSSALKRSVTLSNIHFEYDGIPFRTKTRYRFVEDNGTYYAIVYHQDGTTTYVPSPTKQITVPFFDVYQYNIEKEQIRLPNYEHGNYYTYEFDTDDNYLSDLKVYVNHPIIPTSNLEGELFTIKTVKYLESQFDKTCFLKSTSPNNFILEFGSGIRGIHIPNATVTLYKETTKGKDGHISAQKLLSLASPTIATIRTYDSSTLELNNPINSSLESISSTGSTEKNLSLRYFTVGFDYCDLGKNSPNADQLKESVIKHIQTRDFLIDKKDYYNLSPNDAGDFVYSFRKSDIHRNDFYLHKVVRDDFQVPYITNCLNLKKLNTGSAISGLIGTTVIETDGNVTGNYQYIIFATDGFFINTPVVIDFDIPFEDNAVQLSWDEYLDTNYYIIIAYNGVYSRYFWSYEPFFLDYGQDSNFRNTFISQAETDLTYFDWKDSYIFFPEFEINSRTYKSPFVFKYDKYFKWFIGHLFYDNFIMLFSNTREILSGHVTPHFQLQVLYDYEYMSTIFYLKSAQASEDYIPLITVTNTNIVDQKMTRVDENTFSIEYSNNEYGILVDSVTVKIEIYYATEDDQINTSIGMLSRSETSQFHQMQKIDDQMKLLTYIAENDDEYLLSIPLIEKEKYLNDQANIDMLLLSDISQNNVEGRRFPGDEVQFRFLNTDVIYNLNLKNSIKQNYDFDLKLPLRLFINITYDSQYIDSNLVNLPKERDDLYLKIADLLQNKYSGNMIKYYDSQLIDFIHSNRPFIKRVQVEVKDSDDNLISDGIESYEEEEIMRNLQNIVYERADLSKIDILNYFPHYFHWDVNDIQINYSF